MEAMSEGSSAPHRSALSGILSEIETGATPANTYRLAAIARALGVSVPELFDTPQETWKVEIVELLDQLNPEDRAAFLRMARAMAAAHAM
jgi:hypothetical protein